MITPTPLASPSQLPKAPLRLYSGGTLDETLDHYRAHHGTPGAVYEWRNGHGTTMRAVTAKESEG